MPADFPLSLVLPVFAEDLIDRSNRVIAFYQNRSLTIRRPDGSQAETLRAAETVALAHRDRLRDSPYRLGCSRCGGYYAKRDEPPNLAPHPLRPHSFPCLS